MYPTQQYGISRQSEISVQGDFSSAQSEIVKLASQGLGLLAKLLSQHQVIMLILLVR